MHRIKKESTKGLKLNFYRPVRFQEAVQRNYGKPL